MAGSSGIANVAGFIYESPVTQFPVRSGPGVSNPELFKAQKGTNNLPVLDVQPDQQNTPNDADKTQVYQWFKLQFPDGQIGWLRAHILTIQGDFSAFGYGLVGTAVYAYQLRRGAPAAVAAPAPVAPAVSTPAVTVAASPSVNPVTAPAAATPAPAAPAPAPTPVAVAVPVPATPAPTSTGTADDSWARPAKQISGTGGAFTAWNNYGGLIQQLASQNGIQSATILAILAIESGGSGFVNGRLKIRFENHIFRKYMVDAGRQADYDANFAGGLAWNDNHQYKDPATGQFVPTHTGRQDTEWAALTLAQKLDAEFGARSISMGASQVMGFNFRSNGFASAVDMLAGYSRSETEHIKGMFNFLKNRGLIDEMQRNDFEGVALGYNGSGQVQRYGNLMRQAYNGVKPALDAIGAV